LLAAVLLISLKHRTCRACYILSSLTSPIDDVSGTSAVAACVTEG
jgi:hypothetical protein